MNVLPDETPADVLQPEDPPEEKPPVFRSWKGWYVLVIGFLGLLIILFFLFTKHFS